MMLLRVPSETCARLKQGTETYRPRTNAFLFRLITEKNLMMVLSRVVIEPKNLNILGKKKIYYGKKTCSISNKANSLALSAAHVEWAWAFPGIWR